MPSVEILCIGQRSPLVLPDLPFAVEADWELRSHRGSSSLWQGDFDRLTGCIYHLGNPDLAHSSFGRIFLASELLTERSLANGKLLEFAVSFQDGIAHLLDRLLIASPERQIVVTSDWQFGPGPPTRGYFETLEGFWAAHDHAELSLNALYTVGAALRLPVREASYP